MKLKSCITALLILLYWNSYGQQSNETRKRTAVETALLDSAYRYEKLKPTFYHLESAYEYQSKEVESLRKALRVSELQSEVERRGYESQLLFERKKSKRKGLKWFGIGLASGYVLGKLF